ncbi:MauM/NapG family ferredoxin-type protein [Cognatazoarcus halotolerans]|uniref:MauM/NapG family ferredoxin-type protein n=1 Tax=Cognatazoarcus halotolerans TaxID=2686016 RepID=UPI00135A87B0|nr:MauM/NapG family ferredoxin-type protein [Cognatazoarcus halotolerans]MCB1901937.1 MauM/NapG family ferredoxin-type protein [Rhodocyclaceae bacterium]MCP5310057.1 MauM/NapG family ferredoxin-type protein [Zoogloeaceae bacterium]
MAGKDAGSPGRRRFIERCVALAGSSGVVGLLLAAHGRQAAALPAWAIRPPGALAEEDFAAACVRCGLCVQACPFDILELAPLGRAVPLGTPYFVARQAPCEMCADIPCVAACPTEALSKALDHIEDARMGIAVFTGADTCYAVTGFAECRACFMACPLRGRAITMERRHSESRGYFQPTVHPDACTGCGKCEHACATVEASIKVLPVALARHDPRAP